MSPQDQRRALRGLRGIETRLTELESHLSPALVLTAGELAACWDPDLLVDVGELLDPDDELHAAMLRRLQRRRRVFRTC